MREIISILPELSQLETVMSFAEKAFDGSKVENKERAKTLLLLEETFVQLVSAYNGKGQLTVTSRKKGDIVKFCLRCAGSRLEYTPEGDVKADLENMDAAAEAAIRQMILNANAENFKAAYRNGVNTVTLISGRPSSSAVKKMLISLGVAFAAGLVLRLIPAEAAATIDSFLLVPVRTVFMNGLKMIVAPLVFFSIAASVSSFSDLRELGKTGGKVILFYTFTTVIAVALSVLMFNVFDPGVLGQLSFSGTEAAEAQSFSIMDTVIGIIPSNIAVAFCNSDTLQLIFLAIIFGLAATMLGKSSAKVSDFLSCGSELVVKVAEMITTALPVMIFVSISHLILTTTLDTIRSIGAMVLCIVICDLLMMVVYSILVLVLGKRNPVAFMRAAMPAWLNAFALSSSNAAMPFTMNVCEKNLRVDKSVYSFSIPLGATINMDGVSIILSFSTLFFAKMCGMPLGGASILSMAFTVLVLSFGCPGIPGASIICISILFEQFGIPMECVALFAAADALLDPIGTADNVFGDVVGTYVIAARNKLLHEEE